MGTKTGSRRWLLITASTAHASSTLRVHMWRRLRSLGALYLQQSVCLLPEHPETGRVIKRLLDRVRRERGEGRVIRIEIPDRKEEEAIIEAFRRERSEEYAEVRSRVPAFLAEITLERRRGRATYAEVEESEADLERLRRWLASIRARDYFDAAGYGEAAGAVEECATVLAQFEAEAFAAEVPEPRAGGPRASGKTRRRVIKRG